MPDRPINLKDWQVRAALDGRLSALVVPLDKMSGWTIDFLAKPPAIVEFPWKPGDRLWARETYVCDHYEFPRGGPAEMREFMDYRATHSCDAYEDGCPCDDGQGRGSWRSSTTMPRWASRLTLIPTSARVCRVQEVTEDEARACGAAPSVGGWWTASEGHAGTTPRAAFALAWGAQHGPGSWDANPWACIATVDVHHRNIDSMEE